MCPPGVDQTTRTQQRWTLLSPVLEEKYEITDDLSGHYSGNYSLDYYKLLNGDYTWDAFDKLAQYQRDGARAHSILSTVHYRSRRGEVSLFEALPTEIINMILSNPCLEARDTVSLGLSCRLLWTNVLEQIIRQCQTAPWAGTPLICTGTWTMSLPPTLHAMMPEMKQQEQEFFNRPGRWARGSGARGMCPARQFNWGAYDEYVTRDENCNGSIWVKSLSTASQNASIPQTYLKVLRRSLEAVAVPKRSTMPKSWILRNHTTKEYISMKSGSTSSTLEQYVHVKGVPWLTLDRVLLLKICWSASYHEVADEEESVEAEGIREEVRKKIERGMWAGHCFDVVPSTEHAGSSGEGWSDVTQRTVKEAVAWKAMFNESRYD